MTRIPLERYPGFSKFVLDWLRGDTRFLSRRVGAESRRRVGDDERASAPPRPRASAPLVNALIESNRRWGLFVREDVERWARGEGRTLVGGQQVGFAGGPLYTLAKIASLLKMKRDFESRGEKVTVFFWLATEDHDWDEVAKIWLPVKDGQRDLLQLRAMRGIDSKAAVGPLPIPEPLIEELLAWYGAPRPSWLRPGITFRDSFAELVASILGNGVVLVDSLLPELRRAGAPLFEQIGAKWDDVQRTIAARSRALQDAGYTPQVTPREGDPYTLFFRLGDDGNRDILQPPFDVPPERVSTSALTRPLLQDFVFQPDVFIGGPAEVSYCAQIAPLYEMLGIDMPRVALRGHALIAPKRVVRFIDRYQLDPAKIFDGVDALLATREGDSVGQVQAEADVAKKQLFEHIERIRQLALPADHAVARSIHRSIGHIDYHFRKLTERAIRGLVRKDKERLAAVRELVATLHPDGHVQDRVAAWIAYWCEFDQHLLTRLVEEIEPDVDKFRIVSL